MAIIRMETSLPSFSINQENFRDIMRLAMKRGEKRRRESYSRRKLVQEKVAYTPRAGKSLALYLCGWSSRSCGQSPSPGTSCTSPCRGPLPRCNVIQAAAEARRARGRTCRPTRSLCRSSPGPRSRSESLPGYSSRGAGSLPACPGSKRSWPSAG